MEQSWSWEANSHSASQEIPGRLWNPKVLYSAHKSPLLVAILNEKNRLQTYSIFHSNPCKCCAFIWTRRFPKWYLHRNLQDWMPEFHIVAYRAVAKRSFCKERPLLDNARKIHARNNRTTGLCNQFLSYGSVNMFPRKRTHATIEQCFRCGPRREVDLEDN
jgi:hypothetical protein